MINYYIIKYPALIAAAALLAAGAAAGEGPRRLLIIDDDVAMWREGVRRDGIHGVITNEAELSAVETLSRYRGLWRIEDTFRLTKHELKTRPIYHWTAGRIEAHILLCFVALSVAKQAVYRLAAVKQPMIFERLRNELLHVQSSQMVDRSTGRRCLVPSHVTVAVKEIYHAFGLKRSEVPRRLD